MAVTPTNVSRTRRTTNMLKDIFIEGNGGLFGAVARLGVPVVLSVIFAVFLLWRVESALAALQTSAVEHKQTTTAAAEKMDKFATDSKEGNRVLTNLLLQVCINTAKTDDDERECVKAR